MWDGQRHHYRLKGAQTDFADPAGRPLPQIGLPLANIAQQGTPNGAVRNYNDPPKPG